ncbi:unnamed protein product, partial [marine sediment metagenome]
MILLALLVTILFLSFFVINTKGSSDLIFVIDQEEFYSSNDIDYYTDFNIKNATELSGNYNATYSFTDL